jgi:hypothetical protein
MRNALSFLVAAALSAALAQPQANVCESFAAADISGVVGAAASAGRQLVPGTCVWTAKGISLTIARIDTGDRAAALALVDAVKARGQKGDDIHDEGGLGDRAVSTVNSNKRGLSLVAADRGTSWNLTVDSGDQAIDVVTVLPKLRALLRKGIGTK